MNNHLKNQIPSIALLAVPEASGAALYGLFEILSTFANAWGWITGEDLGCAGFEVNIVAATEEPFRCAGGVPVIPSASIADIQHSDVVIVTDLAIDPEADHREKWLTIQPWLSQMHNNGSLICSVCSGSVLLASSGLLDHKTATTHWGYIKHFQQFFPAVQLLPNRVLIPEDNGNGIVTSGGMAAWEDLAQYLIARFYGEAAAIKTAKLFLLGDRSEGQLIFSAMGKPKRHEDAVIERCQQWIASHYPASNPVQQMVKHSGLAERTFKRRFKLSTGYTPIDYVQTLRVEEAKQILEASADPIDTIALQVGYEDSTSFRRLFKRMVGVTPSRYRQRFQSRPR